MSGTSTTTGSSSGTSCLDDFQLKMEYTLDAELELDGADDDGGASTAGVADMVVSMEMDNHLLELEEQQLQHLQQQQQQQQLAQQQQPTSSSSVVFGSQLVNKDSITPYSDATQVSATFRMRALRKSIVGYTHTTQNGE